ncbi:MAG: class I tRNA ligase family protein, partial [Verrucomicrobia bacterium]|nr:class I tRNA ligase family protein [Verrucomicrobiota bacterium]
EVIAEYGADSLRLYEMFMGPLETSKPWSMSGVEGVYRFLARVWRLVMIENQEGNWQLSPALVFDAPSHRLRKVMHATIKKVTQDVEALSFNTAIAQMMIFVNELTGSEKKPVSAVKTLLLLLNPFSPHLSEELWFRLKKTFDGFDGLASQERWPTWEESVLAEEEIEIIVQINGKVRDRIRVRKDLDAEELQQRAVNLPKIREAAENKIVRKVVVVPNKVINLVLN